MTEPRPAWSKLRHAYGPASDVPDALADLTSTDADDRRRALEWLSSALHHQCSVFSATPQAVPILLEALDAEGVDRAGVLTLLAAIALGDVTAYEVGGLREPAPSKRPAAQERCFFAVKAGLARYRERLADDDPATRAAAAFLLAWFSSDGDASRAALRARLADETDVVVRASLVLALGYLGAATRQDGDAPALRQRLRPSELSPVRAAAAIALAHLGPAHADAEVFAALQEAILDAAAPSTLPFSDGDLGGLALAVLPALPAACGDPVPVLVEALARPERSADAAALAIERLLPDGPVPRRERLTTAQRALLEAMARAPGCFTSEVSAALERRSLPGQALPLREWLGLAPERPASLLDRVSGTHPEPLGERLAAASRGDAAGRDRLVEELSAELPAADLARLALDADLHLETTPGSAAAIALTGLLLRLMTRVGPDAVPLLSEEAARLLRDGPPRKLTSLGTALCVFQPLLVGVGLAFAALARGEAADPVVDRLLANPPRVVFPPVLEALGALPEARRDAWMLAPEVDFEAQPSDGMVGAWPYFVRWPSPAITAHVLRRAAAWTKKDRWGKPRKTYADPFLWQYAAALRNGGNVADAARCEALLPR